MSGEAFGTMSGDGTFQLVSPLGGCLLLAGGLLAGTVMTAAVLGKKAVGYAVDKKIERDLMINQCSAQLDTLYRAMAQNLKQEGREKQLLLKNLQDKVSRTSTHLQELAEKEPDLEVYEETIKESREQISHEVDWHIERAETNALNYAQYFENEIEKNFSRSYDQLNSMMRWQEKTEAARKRQASQTQIMLKDAAASLKVLQDLVKNAGGGASGPAGDEQMGMNSHARQENGEFSDSARPKTGVDSGYVHPKAEVVSDSARKKIGEFSDSARREKRLLSVQLEALQSNLERAENYYKMGIYESAFAESCHIITKAASLSYSDMQKELEKDYLRAILESKISGLKAELEDRQVIDTIDQASGEQIQENLNAFSKNQYQETLEQLEKELEEIRSSDLSEYELKKRLQEFEETTQSQAENMVDEAVRNLNCYYERLHALAVVVDYMNEQGYAFDWFRPEGNDCSRKLVASFTSRQNGSTIVVTFDADESSEELEKMVMEVLTFYHSGQEVTEEEKFETRQGIENALGQAGFEGSLTCSGKKNASSDRIEYTSEENVLNMQTE